MRILKGKSGITILFRPMKSGLVDLRYFVKCGAMDEARPEDEGLCHALEHMLYAGTKNRDWMQMNRDLEKLGSWFNAFTMHDRTIYLTTCLRRHWKSAYEVLADMLYNPTFPVERWEDIEKGAVISEIQSMDDDPSFVLSEGLYLDALGKRYHPIVGNVENIRRATMPDLQSFYDRYYCGSNVLLVVTGDLTETELLEAVNKYDRLRSDRPPRREKLNFKFSYKTFARKRKELEQNLLELLKPLKRPRTLKGQVGLIVATKCLSQYLFEELREKRGLCYGARADLYWDIPNHLFLNIETATDAERFTKTKRALNAALHDFPEKGLTKQRIQNIKMYEIFNTVGDTEDIDESADWLWDAWEDQVLEDPFKHQLSILENLDVRTVKRAAAQAFAGRMKFGKITEG